MTGKRHKRAVKPAESERLERLARLMAAAEQVWGNPDDAREFLATPHPLLGDRRPLDLVEAELGVRRVEELLERLEHSLPP